MRQPKPRFKNPWSSEEEIAAAVREALKLRGWTVYPETNGYDLFAVAGNVLGVDAGDQLGVEVKLDGGTATGLGQLLRQITPPRFLTNGEPLAPKRGPHFLAVVSARLAGREFWRRFGIQAVETARTLHRYESGDYRGKWSLWHRLTAEEIAERLRYWPARRATQQPLDVPEIVVDVPAGVPSPSTSSPWKIKAVRMMLRIRNGQAITSADFAAADVNVSRFRTSGWVVDSGARDGRFHVLAPGPDDSNPPDLRWPEIATALREGGL